MTRVAAPRPLRILQIGTIDEGGGAAAVAAGLGRAYRARGCRTWYVVGRKQGADPSVLVIRENRKPLYRLIGYSAIQVRLRRMAGQHPNRGFGLAGRLLRFVTHPTVVFDHLKGREDFEFPGSYEVLDMLDRPADIAQCHNLHGGYFDLRALEWLSRQLPTVLTLHDMWMLTGHCAHSLTCDRWQTGCGACPDLTLDPPVRADATAVNWNRKRAVYARSSLYVATPSQWLMDKVQQSMLAPAIAEARVIPNGVDLNVFHPGDKAMARAALGIPQDVRVVLLTTGSLGSMWKDDATLIGTIERIAIDGGAQPLFIALGRETAVPRAGHARVRSVRFQNDPHVIATYCQAADVYLHAAKADTAPLAVLEAMACGTPVVATSLGGIPEQIRPVAIERLAGGYADVGEATGVLVPPRNADAMAQALRLLLDQPDACHQLGVNAAADVRARFSLEQQADAYLAWYREIIDRGKSPAVPAAACAAQA